MFSYEYQRKNPVVRNYFESLRSLFDTIYTILENIVMKCLSKHSTVDFTGNGEVVNTYLPLSKYTLCHCDTHNVCCNSRLTSFYYQCNNNQQVTTIGIARVLRLGGKCQLCEPTPCQKLKTHQIGMVNFLGGPQIHLKNVLLRRANVRTERSLRASQLHLQSTRVTTTVLLVINKTQVQWYGRSNT